MLCSCVTKYFFNLKNAHLETCVFSPLHHNKPTFIQSSLELNGKLNLNKFRAPITCSCTVILDITSPRHQHRMIGVCRLHSYNTETKKYWAHWKQPIFKGRFSILDSDGLVYVNWISYDQMFSKSCFLVRVLTFDSTVDAAVVP